jgi:hypothetical protein
VMVAENAKGTITPTMTSRLSGTCGSRRFPNDSPSIVPLVHNRAFLRPGLTRIPHCARTSTPAAQAENARVPRATTEHERARVAVNVRNEKSATKAIPDEFDEVFDRPHRSKA